MFDKLKEIINYIEKSKFSTKLGDIIQKINQLKYFYVNNDYKNAVDYALYINRTTDYEGVANKRENFVLVNENLNNNPIMITPEQHIYKTLEALTKLALKKITDYIKDKNIEKIIEINWNDNIATIFKIVKSLNDKE